MRATAAGLLTFALFATAADIPPVAKLLVEIIKVDTSNPPGNEEDACVATLYAASRSPGSTGGSPKQWPLRNAGNQPVSSKP